MAGAGDHVGDAVGDVLGGEDLLDVDGDHPVPLFGVCAGDGAQEHQAGIVDQGVQPPEPPGGLLYGVLGLGAVGDVGFHGQRGAARLADLGGESFQTVPAAGNQRDGGTVSGEPAGGGSADAAARAGHERGGALGYALFSPVYADPARPPNNARFIFLDPHAGGFFRDWDKVANDTVALLRAEAGREPYDRQLSDLIGELTTRSDEFRVRWAAHHVRIHTTGVKLIHHPVAGDLELAFESFPLAADPSQSLLTYTAEPGSPSQDALSLLASWAASTAHDSHASKQPERSARTAGRPAARPRT